MRFQAKTSKTGGAVMMMGAAHPFSGQDSVPQKEPLQEGRRDQRSCSACLNVT